MVQWFSAVVIYTQVDPTTTRTFYTNNLWKSTCCVMLNSWSDLPLKSGGSFSENNIHLDNFLYHFLNVIIIDLMPKKEKRLFLKCYYFILFIIYLIIFFLIYVFFLKPKKLQIQKMSFSSDWLKSLSMVLKCFISVVVVWGSFMH